METRVGKNVMNYRVSTVTARIKCKNFKRIFVRFLFSLPLGRVSSFGRDLKCVFTPDS